MRGGWLTMYQLVGVLVVTFLGVTLIAYSYLSGLEGLQYGGLGGESTYGRKPKMLIHAEPANSLRSPDLLIQIEELKKVKASVNKELRDLEAQLQSLKNDVKNYTMAKDAAVKLYDRAYVELDKMQMVIASKRLEQEDLDERYTPKIRMPERLLPAAVDRAHIPLQHSPYYCRTYNCFDYARCSLTSQFPVYFYDVKKYSFMNHELLSFVKTSVTHAFHSSPYTTHDPSIACVYIALLDVESVKTHRKVHLLQSHIHKLPFWGKDGRNHILLNLAHSYSNVDIFENIEIGRAMIAQSTFLDVTYRRDYDVILPPSLGKPVGETWRDLLPLVPAKRKHLLSFQGSLPFLNEFTRPPRKTKDIYQNVQNDTFQGPQRNLLYANQDSYQSRQLKFSIQEETPVLNNFAQSIGYLVDFERALVEALKRMQRDYAMDGFYFQFACDTVDKSIEGLHGEWALCGPASERHRVLKQSTFALILAPLNTSIISTTLLQTRVYEALKYGAVPVIIGNYVRLPFEDLLPWDRATLILPKARVTELHFLLRSITDADILEYRRQGRLLWETHMATSKAIIDTLLANIRTRINIPAAPAKDEPSPSVFNDTFVPITEEVSLIDVANTESDDFLGVVEEPFASPRFMRNFTYNSRDFASVRDPFHMYPMSPFDPVLPSDAKYNGSEFGFRPIGDGIGGAGKEFSESLGGNWPREQFTVVMLTYEREAVLLHALARLKGLPHLNKVLVVWNSPQPPSADLHWPLIHVPIHVVRTKKNSLNNRFLPYDVIETEAVLSIDDDAHLRHDEIIFGFRVWRENRDRLVGFPGRYHAWDRKSSNWFYNSNYTCELSMVLTGAAFFHKYYAYLYSYVQPQAIRDKVDEYMNCEDLAMNFLVSHVTRQPPIKVTTRWTFRCPGCPVALSVDEEHFAERHKCMNFFTQVYGYMPLLHTQFRADSVLFKTRIPHEKQKCFKYI